MELLHACPRHIFQRLARLPEHQGQEIAHPGYFHLQPEHLIEACRQGYETRAQVRWRVAALQYKRRF
jgi:hypothetical protein